MGTTDIGYTDQLIVKLKSQTSAVTVPLAVTSRLEANSSQAFTYIRPMAGGAHVFKLPQFSSVADVKAIAARLVANDSDVEYAEPDYLQHALLAPNDPMYTNQWHYFDAVGGIDLPAAWDLTTGSSSVVVAVVDTGYRPHVDLSGKFLAGYDFISDATIANDGNGRDSDASDPGDWVTTAEATTPGGFFYGCPAENSSWHGTHVAGTIAADTNNSVGVAGVSWNSKILPVRVLGKCGGYTSDISDGVTWAAGLAVSGVPTNSNPAKVINMSLGGQHACSTTEQTAINSAVAAGATVVVSAGNSNADASAFSPASCNNVITVAATGKTGSRASYSNYGSVVEISAPGGDGSYSILSTLNAGTTVPGADSYAYYQGTSMAAPHVSGVVALMLAASPTLTPAQILTKLQSTARAFPGGSTCTTSICGAGIVDAGAAVAAVSVSAPSAPTLISPSGTSATMTPTYSWNASSGATSYTLYVGNNAGAVIFSSYTASSLGCGSGTGTCSVTPSTSLTNGSSYSWFVLATNAGGSSPWSTGKIFTVSAGTAPSAPTLVSPTGTITTTTPTYTWNAVTGATNYTLYVGNNSGAAVFASYTASSLGCSSGTGTCSVTPSTALSGGTSYSWFVLASNSVGNSPWSSGLVFTVSAGGVPLAPTLLSPSGTIASTTPTYSWNASAGATSYSLYVGNSSGAAIFTSYSASSLGCGAGTGTCSVTPSTALVNGSSYSWFVLASNSVGSSPWSGGLIFTVNTSSPPAAPTLVSPKGTIATTTPTYTWNASSGATSYSLYVGNSSGAAIFTSYSASSLGCGAGTGTCSVTPSTALASGTSYSWFVLATSSVGNSPWSAGLIFTTP